MLPPLGHIILYGRAGGAPSPVNPLEREGKLTVPIGGRFPLADAVQAHRFLESRCSTGKLLLIP